MTDEEISGYVEIPNGAKILRLKHPAPIGKNEKNIYDYIFEGKIYKSPLNGWGIEKNKMDKLVKLKRVQPKGNILNYILFYNDFPITKVTNPWNDTVGSQDKRYIVQTGDIPIQRCILMTTDPGDLVLDPTCGSGTTAFVAEQWGRRWITIDTSRIALNIAKTNLLTASFPYYNLYDESSDDIRQGFIYKKVNHITLESLTNAEPIEEKTLYDQPEIDKKKLRVSGP
ncbi:site-specific DNA-methyltransferase, partial [Candidatus Sumerlaeota bacterium]|nr:site-specific DNA-methyltransferase [Candidatus Sumerlaeota bacterium]